MINGQTWPQMALQSTASGITTLCTSIFFYSPIYSVHKEKHNSEK